MSRLAAMTAMGLLIAPPAQASIFGEGSDLAETLDRFSLNLHGNLRLRSNALVNFDLDRGLSPSGAAVYAVPLGDPSSQLLTRSDMRLRLDLSVEEPDGSGVFTRFSVLDGVSLGSAPDGSPIDATRQLTLSDALTINYAYARIATPVGVLFAGRTPSHFGLGIAANAGEDEDADATDSADRIAFSTPLVSHVFTLAYDFGSGPTGSVLDPDPSDDTRSVVFAVARMRSDRARARRERAGKTTFDYGLSVSHRWQSRAYPVAESEHSTPVATQAVERGYRALAFDVWARLTRHNLRVELEGVAAFATIDQATLIPGLLLREPVESSQLGAAIESELHFDPVTLGLDLGMASGDAAPGFGARLSTTSLPAAPGDLDGGQLSPPTDVRADNFRFNSEYRVDRILFRELIGRITDAVYVRPHVSVELLEVGRGRLVASLALIGSSALYGSSTPSGSAPLGFEIDPTLAWINKDGFRVSLEHAVLFPLSGFDNPDQGLSAKPAQLFRGRILYAF